MNGFRYTHPNFDVDELYLMENKDEFLALTTITVYWYICICHHKNDLEICRGLKLQNIKNIEAQKKSTILIKKERI